MCYSNCSMDTTDSSVQLGGEFHSSSCLYKNKKNHSCGTAVPEEASYGLFIVYSDQSLSELEYVALYTYESPETSDLTFDEGDVIMVTEREGEWWRGCIGDQTGLFPSNYVHPVEPEVRTIWLLFKTWCCSVPLYL